MVDFWRKGLCSLTKALEICSFIVNNWHFLTVHTKKGCSLCERKCFPFFWRWQRYCHCHSPPAVKRPWCRNRKSLNPLRKNQLSVKITTAVSISITSPVVRYHTIREYFLWWQQPRTDCFAALPDKHAALSDEHSAGRSGCKNRWQCRCNGDGICRDGGSGAGYFYCCR